MTFTTWFLLGELLFVPLIVLITVTVSRVRKKKQMLQELDKLLTRVTKAEADRRSRLKSLLTESFRLDAEEAEDRSFETMQAEKKLFKSIAEIQFETKNNQLSTFDKYVYGLLDHYWELISLAPVTQVAPALKEPPPEVDPTWDEAFDEATRGHQDSAEGVQGNDDADDILNELNDEISISKDDADEEFLEEVAPGKAPSEDDELIS